MFSLSSTPLLPALLLLLLLSLPLFLIFLSFHRPLSPPPISLPDDLDDLSLFRRASSLSLSSSLSPLPSSKSRLGSTNPSPKIAFLFLTNSPLHFSPLWNLFFQNSSSSSYNLYVHADPTVSIPILPPFNPDHFIPSKKTLRSSPTLVSAARRLLAHGLLHDRRNAFFALVSQHCIPLHSFAYLRKTLLSSRTRRFDHLTYRSFIEIESNGTFIANRYC